MLRLLGGAGVAVFLALLYSNYRLRDRLQVLEHSLRRARQQASSRVVRAGERFESLRAIDVAGSLHLLEARAQPSGVMVAVVNPECASCQEVAAELRAHLRARAEPPLWLVSVGDAETTRDFASRNQLEPVTYRLPDDTNPFLRQRLSSVPQVFVVDRHEQVIRTCETVARCAAEAAEAIADTGDDGP
ncbi:MAG TPA: hypothetical protein VF310_09565 [Vicinamibacteria bacterium]